MSNIDSHKPPFQFNLGSLIKRARRFVNSNVEGTNLTLPGVTFRIRPLYLEESVAREIVIRMKNRRVLNSKECCDDCINQALTSLHEIRTILVDKQVDLKTIPDCPLFLLIDFMIEGIRQFLTYEQRLKNMPAPKLFVPKLHDLRRPPEQREKYQLALEMLRAHLHQCLRQVYAIAELDANELSATVKYSDQWDSAAYKLPPLE